MIDYTIAIPQEDLKGPYLTNLGPGVLDVSSIYNLTARHLDLETQANWFLCGSETTKTSTNWVLWNICEKNCTWNKIRLCEHNLHKRDVVRFPCLIFCRWGLHLTRTRYILTKATLYNFEPLQFLHWATEQLLKSYQLKITNIKHWAYFCLMHMFTSALVTFKCIYLESCQYHLPWHFGNQ